MSDKINKQEETELNRHNASIDQDEGNMNHGVIGGDMGELVSDINKNENSEDTGSQQQSGTTADTKD
jgi:hypothetical protein